MLNEIFAILIALSCSFNVKAIDYKKEITTKNYTNVIFILADDLGYGDLSCYGQSKFKTPNIDRLAAEGMLFTQHYAGCTVCAPSRSSLLTGQHTGHTPIRGNRTIEPEGQVPLPTGSYTMAEMFKENGYKTGAFGKWALGFVGTEGDPQNQGFDVFYGYNCQTLAHNYFPGHLWSNHEKIVLKKNQQDQMLEYSPYLIQEQALKFIRDNKDSPFFLYYPSTLPHAELIVPEEEIEKYRNSYLPEKEYEGSDYGDKRFRIGGYGSQSESHAAFAAMISILDQQVGQIMDELKKLGLEENTLVIFTSDNGPHLEGGADPDYFDSNGTLKGYKRDVYEGGIRVPMIAKWPVAIERGSRTEHISAFWDVMPTVAEIINAKKPGNIDGISFFPTLLGRKDQKQHEYLYWEFHEKGGRQAIRKGNWKYVSYHITNENMQTHELYNLSFDIGEERNVAENYPDIMAEMQTILDEARTPSQLFPY